MCSRFAEGDVAVGGRRFFYNSTFTIEALPERSSDHDACLGAPLTPAQRAGFLDFLDDGLLSEARGQGSCGSCWAYALSGAVQGATALAYRRLGGFFNNKYMSPQLLLSCMEIEGVACGCVGGDLAGAMAEVARQGLVTFRQFPYENDSSALTHEAQVHYICRANEGAKGFLGTCAPCGEHEADHEQVVTDVKGVGRTATSLFELVSCLPCRSVGAPFYFPVRPCRLYAQADSLDGNVEAIKRALVAAGPLCATIRVNRADFAKVGKPETVERLQDAPVYRPEATPFGALHSVLIVGYSDPGPRAEAVFVCRNSWGEDWGFKIRSTRVEQLPGGQRASPALAGGFFLVSMYEAAEAIGLVQTAVGMHGMQVRALGDAAPRPLRLTDPFVVPFSPAFLAGVPSARGSARWAALLAVAVLAVTVLAALAALIALWG